MGGEELNTVTTGKEMPEHLGMLSLRELGDMASSVGMRLSDVVSML